MGLMGLSGERGPARVGRAPPSPLVRIGLGEGGGWRPPFLLPLPLPFPLLVGVGKRGVLLLLGGGGLLSFLLLLGGGKEGGEGEGKGGAAPLP